MKLLSTLALSLFLSSLSLAPASADDFEDKLVKVLNEKPEIIIRALEAYQKKMQVAKNDEQKANIKKHAISLGGDNLDHIENQGASKTLVEFFDYNCGYCKKSVETVERLRADKDIKIVYVEFPILGDGSLKAAKYAIATKMMSGPYMDLHHTFMKTNQLTPSKIKEVVKQIGLDPEKIEKFIADNEVAIDMKIQKNVKIANELGINGTPAFVIGEHVISGAAPYVGLKAALEKS